MVDKVESYRAADCTLFHNEEQAYRHDACMSLKELMAGSEFISYDDRYKFAEELMFYAYDWFKALEPYIKWKQAQERLAIGAADVAWDETRNKGMAESYIHALVTSPPPADNKHPGITQEPDSETRRVGLTPTDDEVPF